MKQSREGQCWNSLFGALHRTHLPINRAKIHRPTPTYECYQRDVDSCFCRKSERPLNELSWLSVACLACLVNIFQCSRLCFFGCCHGLAQKAWMYCLASFRFLAFRVALEIWISGLDVWISYLGFKLKC